MHPRGSQNAEAEPDGPGKSEQVARVKAQVSGGGAACRSSWPYLRTPQCIYWLVMAPICGLQVFLVFTPTPGWLRVSASAVIALTAIGYVRGYFRRLILTPEGATLHTLFSRRFIAWRDVRRAGRYVPGGGLGATPYFYITMNDRQPEGRWENDERTLQVQDQAGLEAAVEVHRLGLSTEDRTSCRSTRV